MANGFATVYYKELEFCKSEFYKTCRPSCHDCLWKQLCWAGLIEGISMPSYTSCKNINRKNEWIHHSFQVPTEKEHDWSYACDECNVKGCYSWQVIAYLAPSRFLQHIWGQFKDGCHWKAINFGHFTSATKVFLTMTLVCRWPDPKKCNERRLNCQL